MGSGYSVSYSQQLDCPSDCDQQLFQQILSLYDRLDANGDHAIENKELQAIARLHIDNEIRRIKRKIDEANQSHQRQLTYIRASSSQEMARLKEKLTTKQNQVKEDFEERKEKMNEHVTYLQKMEELERAQKFKAAVSGAKNSIEFWDFYNYMKCRVDDIPNIVW